MKILVILLSFGLALTSAPAFANSVREYSQAEKQAAASLIVIGTVTRYNESGYLGPARAFVKVKTVLKGQAEDQIEVDTSGGGIAEFSVNGLQVGQDYVFYLTHANSAQYVSVNGHFGVIPVSVFKP